MTDLLTPVSRRTGTPAAPPARRPLALGALIAGIGAPAVALSLLWFVGLVGWYADDGGSHGTTLSVLRVAADAWLLAQGSSLSIHHAVVTASPLGLTLFCGFVTYRLARRAGAASDVDDLRSVGLGTVVLAGSYAAVALVVAVLAGVPAAEPGMGVAFLGGAAMGAVFGGAGLLRGSGRAGELRRLIPVPALSVGYCAAVTVLALFAAAALATAVSFAFHWTAAVAVVDHLRLDLTGGLLSMVLLVAIAPNVVVLAATYLLGPGFAFGTGTVVSPAEVHLGPVPSVPVLAALPSDGWAPGWTVAFIAVPVVLAAVAAFLVGRTLPTGSYQSAAGRGLGGGVVAGVLLTIAASSAGGAIGPGRMSHIGVSFGETLMAAVVALGVGAALGALPATWWTRRHEIPDARHPEALRTPPATRPLAGPLTGAEEDTEPVHLPPLTEESLDRIVPHPRRLGPSPSDLATEDTVQIRLPDQRDGKGPKGR